MRLCSRHTLLMMRYAIQNVKHNTHSSVYTCSLQVKFYCIILHACRSRGTTQTRVDLHTGWVSKGGGHPFIKFQFLWCCPESVICPLAGFVILYKPPGFVGVLRRALHMSCVLLWASIYSIIVAPNFAYHIWVGFGITTMPMCSVKSSKFVPHVDAYTVMQDSYSAGWIALN